MADWVGLIAPDLSIGFAALLIGASFFTSALTAAFGIGGGLALMAIMGLVMPVATLIPVHGLIQLGSNSGRAWTLRKNIDFTALIPFMVGGLIAALMASRVVIALPDDWLKAALGIFVIIITWVNVPVLGGKANGVMTVGGFITTGLTMFLGATGPLVIALFAKRFAERITLVATAALAMVFQHAVKVMAFSLLGFAFAPWAPLIGAMIATGYAGTLIGVRLLAAFEEGRFRFWFKILLTSLGAMMVIRSVFALLA
ncbi:MAG: sulfite exporter TauE/SafE family protein [Ahrensia sp.]